MFEHTPPGLGVEGEQRGAEEGGGHEVSDVARQRREAVAGRQRGAQHQVRRWQVLHHQQAQRGVKVVQLRDVLWAVPRLLPQGLRLKPRPLLQAAQAQPSSSFRKNLSGTAIGISSGSTLGLHVSCTPRLEDRPGVASDSGLFITILVHTLREAPKRD